MSHICRSCGGPIIVKNGKCWIGLTLCDKKIMSAVTYIKQVKECGWWPIRSTVTWANLVKQKSQNAAWLCNGDEIDYCCSISLMYIYIYIYLYVDKSKMKSLGLAIYDSFFRHILLFLKKYLRYIIISIRFQGSYFIGGLVILLIAHRRYGFQRMVYR